MQKRTMKKRTEKLCNFIFLDGMVYWTTYFKAFFYASKLIFSCSMTVFKIKLGTIRFVVFSPSCFRISNSKLYNILTTKLELNNKINWPLDDRMRVIFSFSSCLLSLGICLTFSFTLLNASYMYAGSRKNQGSFSTWSTLRKKCRLVNGKKLKSI